jgi:3',5'-cyclic AMP phosphodiesterase CpdA
VRRIAHLSDLHFGRHDPVLATAVAAELNAAPPDLTVISGDLTQRARRRQFAAARAFLAGLPRPILVVPGNHDVPLYDVTRRFLRPLARYRRYVCADTQPSFADAELAVLGINTARSATFSNGRISYAQADAVRAHFRHVPSERIKILVAHHPLMAPPAEPGLPVVGRTTMALAAIAEAGVHVVLCGHFHHAFTADLAAVHTAMRRSVLIIEAGTAISLRLRREPNSYNLIEVERDRLACTVRAWDGRAFRTADEAQYEFADSRWMRRPTRALSPV